MTRIRIEVPATSANLGPGFDTLGMALDVVDVVWAELEPEATSVSLPTVQGTDVALDPEDNLLCRAYRSWGDDAGTPLPGARFTLESRIPVGKGLGSSAASIVAGLAAAAYASRRRDTESAPQTSPDLMPEELDRIVRLAGRLEGHADNVAAAALGGMTAAFLDGRDVHALHVANHLHLGVALFVPDEALLTAQARAALPESIPFRDAVFDLGRLAYLVTALIWGQWDRIGPAMEDRLHQPYRTCLIEGLDDVIAGAREGGAYGAALSGGGPSVIALGPLHRVEQFAGSMEERARARGWSGKAMITRMREMGVQIKEDKPAEENESPPAAS